MRFEAQPRITLHLFIFVHADHADPFGFQLAWCHLGLFTRQDLRFFGCYYRLPSSDRTTVRILIPLYKRLEERGLTVEVNPKKRNDFIVRYQNRHIPHTQFIRKMQIQSMMPIELVCNMINELLSCDVPEGMRRINLKICEE